MATWALIGSGGTITFNGEPFWLVSAIGVGLGPVRRLTESGPFQQGATDIGYRYEMRMINLVVALVADSLSDADAQRDALARVCSPASTALALRCTRDDGAVRQIDVQVVGMVDTPVQKPERLGALQRILVQLQAADPSWYDPTPLALTLDAISNSTRGYPAPVMVPVVQTPGSAIDGTDTIRYAGTWAEHPVIYLIGPLTDPVLSNVTHDWTLNFTGITIASGKTYVIDTRYGYKTVRNGDGGNAIAELSEDSDLADWRLEPGENDINLTASGATGASGARLTYSLRYAGL